LGSLADMAASISDVRLPSDNGHQRDVPARPFRVNTGHGQVFDHLVGALLERHYLKLIKSVRLSVEALGFKGSFVAFALF
jgi:hypothetical protein